jgi:hypothetical protein
MPQTPNLKLPVVVLSTDHFFTGKHRNCPYRKIKKWYCSGRSNHKTRRSFMMKNTNKIFKTFQRMADIRKITVIAIVAAIVFLGSCKSMQLDYLEANSVDGPRQMRQGEDIDPRTITVWGVYKDGSRKVINVSSRDITYNKNAVGPQAVRIRVKNQEVSFQTQVMALRSLTITSQPRTVLFKVGQEADRTWPGLEIQGVWDQMGSQRIGISSCEVTGYNKDQAGRQTIRVSYMGISTTFNVDVRAMTSIRITQPPTKLDYLQGEALDLAGMRVMGTWDGFPEEQLNITTSDITGFSADNSGIQRLTVTKNGMSTTFNVDVWALVGIILDKPPDKIDYMLGEQLDLTGIIINATYAGSTTAKRRTELVPVNQITVSGYNPNTVGRQQRVLATVRGQTVYFFVNVGLSDTGTLVGTWRRTGDITWTEILTLNSNGTGSMVVRYSNGLEDNSPFTWTVSGNTLNTFGASVVTDGGGGSTVTYSLSGNTLTLTPASAQVVPSVFTRQ